MSKIGLEHIVIVLLIIMVAIQYRINLKTRNVIDMNYEQTKANISGFSNALKNRCLIELSNFNTNSAIQDTSYAMLSFSDIISEGSFLFLVLSDKDCTSCLEHALSELNNFLSHNNYRNIAILANVSSIRTYLLQINEYDIKCRSYFIENYPVNYEFIENKPYFFLMTNQLVPKLFFIPEKSMPEFTKIYLETVGQIIN